jgi:UDP-2,3-diacylglucosamine pyrophosphatase LpxH
MNGPCFDTVIISDLHLGSEVSRAEAALRMLKETSFRRLILLGDIFCDLNFRRLTKEHWKFLSYIRKLSNPKRNIEVVWVEGNHDHGLSEVMSHLVGVQVFQEYEWMYNGMRHLAIHGHQFDRMIFHNLFFSNLLTTYFLLLQRLDFGQKRLVRLLDRLNTSWLRLSSKVQAGALAHAHLKGVQRVFCGHTHEALRACKDGIEYFNTGSWTQANATFVTVNEEGVKIHEYTERADDRYSSEERGEVDPALADLFDSAGLPSYAEYEGVAG